MRVAHEARQGADRVPGVDDAPGGGHQPVVVLSKGPARVDGRGLAWVCSPHTLWTAAQERRPEWRRVGGGAQAKVPQASSSPCRSRAGLSAADGSWGCYMPRAPLTGARGRGGAPPFLPLDCPAHLLPTRGHPKFQTSSSTGTGQLQRWEWRQAGPCRHATRAAGALPESAGQAATCLDSNLSR